MDDLKPDEQLLTLDEFANHKLIRKSLPTVRKWIRLGMIPYTQIGNKYFIKMSEVIQAGAVPARKMYRQKIEGRV